MYHINIIFLDPMDTGTIALNLIDTVTIFLNLMDTGTIALNLQKNGHKTRENLVEVARSSLQHNFKQLRISVGMQ